MRDPGQADRPRPGPRCGRGGPARPTPGCGRAGWSPGAAAAPAAHRGEPAGPAGPAARREACRASGRGPGGQQPERGIGGVQGIQRAVRVSARAGSSSRRRAGWRGDPCRAPGEGERTGTEPHPASPHGPPVDLRYPAAPALPCTCHVPGMDLRMYPARVSGRAGPASGPPGPRREPGQSRPWPARSRARYIAGLPEVHGRSMPSGKGPAPAPANPE